MAPPLRRALSGIRVPRGIPPTKGGTCAHHRVIGRLHGEQPNWRLQRNTLSPSGHTRPWRLSLPKSAARQGRPRARARGAARDARRADLSCKPTDGHRGPRGPPVEGPRDPRKLRACVLSVVEIGAQTRGTFTFTFICHPGKTHKAQKAQTPRSRGDTPWRAQPAARRALVCER